MESKYARVKLSLPRLVPIEFMVLKGTTLKGWNSAWISAPDLAMMAANFESSVGEVVSEEAFGDYPADKVLNEDLRIVELRWDLESLGYTLIDGDYWQEVAFNFDGGDDVAYLYDEDGPQA